MNTTINGEQRQFNANQLPLPQLLEELGLSGHPVVVEHNGTALLPAEHSEAVISDGDRLEIVRVVAGG